MRDDIYVQRTHKSHFLVGSCLIISNFEVVFSKTEILQPRYTLRRSNRNIDALTCKYTVTAYKLAGASRKAIHYYDEKVF
jgi:hypothetical protein